MEPLEQRIARQIWEDWKRRRVKPSVSFLELLALVKEIVATVGETVPDIEAFALWDQLPSDLNYHELRGWADRWLAEQGLPTLIRKEPEVKPLPSPEAERDKAALTGFCRDVASELRIPLKDVLKLLEEAYDPRLPYDTVASRLEDAIMREYGIEVKVPEKDSPEYQDYARELPPAHWAVKYSILGLVTSHLLEMGWDPSEGARIVEEEFDPEKTAEENYRRVAERIRREFELVLPEATAEDFARAMREYDQLRELAASRSSLYEERLKAAPPEERARLLETAKVSRLDGYYVLEAPGCPKCGASLQRLSEISYQVREQYFECRDCHSRFELPVLGLCPYCGSPKIEPRSTLIVKTESIPAGFVYYGCPGCKRMWTEYRDMLVPSNPYAALRKIRSMMPAPPPVPVVRAALVPPPLIEKPKFLVPPEFKDQFYDWLATVPGGIEDYEKLDEEQKKRLFYNWLTLVRRGRAG
ncbi:MAG: hypothetical protein QXR87_03280 [Candidatus Hadarchaeales archaeon]